MLVGGEKLAAVPLAGSAWSCSMSEGTACKFWDSICFIAPIRNVWNEQFGIQSQRANMHVFFSGLVQQKPPVEYGERWEGVGASNTAPAPCVCVCQV